MTRHIAIDQIPIGSVCEFNIVDESGVLLLRKGERMTKTAREGIERRRVQFVAVTDAEYAAFERSLTRTVSETTPDHDDLSSGKVSRVDRRGEPLCPVRAEEFSRQLTRSAQLIAMLGARIDQLTLQDVKLLMDGPRDLLPLLRDDSDQVLRSLGENDNDLALADRCVEMSVLAMNTAIEMGLMEEEVISIGQAGLIHDLAIFNMPLPLQDPRYALNDDEAWQYRRHPLIVEKLPSFDSISQDILGMVRQVHERLDGSGYPVGLRANAQHRFASILAIADFYLTLTRPGPGRPAVVPADAIQLLIVQAHKLKFDWVALRAFIAHMTLYAIGSEVGLDDGKTVTIVRRNRHHFARPIVEERTGTQTVRIDLAESQQRVVRPVLDPKRNAMRLDHDMITNFDAALFER